MNRHVNPFGGSHSPQLHDPCVIPVRSPTDGVILAINSMLVVLTCKSTVVVVVVVVRVGTPAVVPTPKLVVPIAIAVHP